MPPMDEKHKKGMKDDKKMADMRGGMKDLPRGKNAIENLKQRKQMLDEFMDSPKKRK